MRLANVGGRASIILGDRVLDVHTASAGELGPDPAVLSDLAHHQLLGQLADAADSETLPVLDPALLGAPTPKPGKVIALALNYRSHAEESGKAIPDEPHVMVKFPSSICGPYDNVILPEGRNMIDYEAEIVLVVGKRCTAVSEAEAWDVVAGVTCGQDISDRGEQFRPPIKQFSMAKSYDTFGPTGPFLVTPDDLVDRDDIEMTCRVNGEQVQYARSSDFIFSVPTQIAWLSRFVTLEPGDLIFTGTTGGVGESRTPELFLQDGWTVETEIPGIGSTRNTCVSK
ncbi:fumarylacetoacetate hydrolase family protein [Streptomyces sp. NPDC059460]|uniref:fumarylacetoacetate hydrolase family protein n=1 Tax=Streptomyces sp. NPDC059460 TaxID=3346840 RepID=UPI0036AB9985